MTRFLQAVKVFGANQLQIFTDAVEDDDGVIDRITDDGQNRGNEGQVDFESQQREDRHDDEGVVQERDDTRNREPVLESDRHVDDDEQ